MYTDDILQEIREFRDAYAKKFNYDIEAMARDLEEQAKNSGHPLVPYPPPWKKTGDKDDKAA